VLYLSPSPGGSTWPPAGGEALAASDGAWPLASDPARPPLLGQAPEHGGGGKGAEEDPARRESKTRLDSWAGRSGSANRAEFGDGSGWGALSGGCAPGG